MRMNVSRPSMQNSELFIQVIASLRYLRQKSSDTILAWRFVNQAHSFVCRTFGSELKFSRPANTKLGGSSRCSQNMRGICSTESDAGPTVL
jgi:hypothetical protein